MLLGKFRHQAETQQLERALKESAMVTAQARQWALEAQIARRSAQRDNGAS